ncbi:MAG: serine--tRNA ligase, partial [Flavobacteriales bacterium]
MLQVNYIRDNKEKVLAGLAKRHKDFTTTIEEVLVIDENRRKTQNELDGLLAEANKLAKEIGDLFKSGKKDEADVLKARTSEIKESTKQLEVTLGELEEQQKQLLYQIPNVPFEAVAAGKTP